MSFHKKIFHARIQEEPIPDFTTDTIEILELGFAKKIYEGTLIF